MISNKVFLVDSNALITPYQQYYPFDFAQSFWNQIRVCIERGEIAILDLVKLELQKGDENDPLRKWIEETKIKLFVDHREATILEQYANVLQYVQDCGYYNDIALANWSDLTVADPWLIAAAKAKGFFLVTFETNIYNLDTRNKTKRVRIPDVANHFGLNTVKLFDMMRALNVHF